ncbi:MAG: hypothetical protein U1E72_06830 [Burkholderiaceae bacterium]
MAEPVINGAGSGGRYGAGVQDTAEAEDIIGRTATLEVRMVNERRGARRRARRRRCPSAASATWSSGAPIIIYRQVVLTGDAGVTDAQAGFDGQNLRTGGAPGLDAKGARIFKDVTRDNVVKPGHLLFRRARAR